MKNNDTRETVRISFVLCVIFMLLIAAASLTGCGAPEISEISVTPLQTEPPVSTEAPAATPAATATVPSAAPEASPDKEPPPTMTQQPSATPENTPGSRTVVADGFWYEKLGDALKERITGMSYPAGGGEIEYSDLRYITVKYVDFEGIEHSGELVANKKVAKELCEIFKALYDAGYPIARMRLVDDYGEPGDDNLSMADNNTSCFNYRRVTGSKTLSRHSYGLAVDINPAFNPYIDGDRIAPPNAAAYADRSLKLPGMIDHDDLCYRLFTERGWTWGGDWDEPDYQHFSKSP